MRQGTRPWAASTAAFRASTWTRSASSPEYDPSYAVVQGPFTALINQYLRTELKYETDLTYRVLTGQVQPWNFGAPETAT